jgi:hypothetical protein
MAVAIAHRANPHGKAPRAQATPGPTTQIIADGRCDPTGTALPAAVDLEPAKAVAIITALRALQTARGCQPTNGGSGHPQSHRRAAVHVTTPGLQETDATAAIAPLSDVRGTSKATSPGLNQASGLGAPTWSAAGVGSIQGQALLGMIPRVGTTWTSGERRHEVPGTPRTAPLHATTSRLPHRGGDSVVGAEPWPLRQELPQNDVIGLPIFSDEARLARAPQDTVDFLAMVPSL